MNNTAECFSTGVFLGLWLDSNDGDTNLGPGSFDGMYTYFASEGHGELYVST
jgi:hypothetical protein